MNKIAKKLLLVALSTVLVGAGTTAVYNVYNDQPTVTASAEAEMTAVATFEFGANGSASHSDGTDTTEDKSYSETVGSYTLSISGASKMYTGARDAKGNSCIKLGTSSVVASFSFTVPDDVVQVVIKAAKYKAKTSKLSVNGTTYTLSNSSDNGTYDEITVDTSSTKTVSIATVSGGVRAMINSITFYAAPAGEEVEPLQEIVKGANSVEVADATGKEVELKTNGVHVLNWAEGETNGKIVVDGEEIALPYTVTLTNGAKFQFTVQTANGEADTVDFNVGIPADGSTLTVAQALAMDITAVAGNKYYVEGTVSRYADAYKGSLYIKDADGSEIQIYGVQKVYPATEEGEEDYVESFKDFWYEDKPQVGATVKFYGEISAYNGINQFADAECEIIAQPETDPEAALPEDGSYLSIAEINELTVTSDTLRQYYVTGVITEIKNTTYGNVYIEDREGNQLYVYGLYDYWTGNRFDKMEEKPAVGDQITVKSILSVYNGTVQLKNARMTEFGPAPIELNMNGTTTVSIPEGGTITAIGTPDLMSFTGLYQITWDETVTNLQVGMNWMSQSGMVLDHYSPYESFQISFTTTDGAALTVDVTVTPYVEVIPELELGTTAIDVAGEVKVQVTTPGEYVLNWAEGETNGFIMMETMYGAEMVEMPYNFTVAEGESYVFVVMTQNWSADVVDVVLSDPNAVPVIPENGSILTIEEALALDVEAAAGNKYYVEGKVVSYSDAYKGSLYIADENGNEICIYGIQIVYSEDYIETFKDMWYSDKPLVGATVKFYGEVGAYKGVNQFVDAEFEIISQPEVDPEEELPYDLETLAIADVLALPVTKDTLRQYFVTGTVVEITQTTYGNMYIEDEAGNRLLIYGLYDMWTGDRFDKMDVQPEVGDVITVKSILSVYNGTVQLKNARLTEITVPPVELNLNGTTTISIPEGGSVVAIGTPDLMNFTGYYIVTWDDVTVTNLQVGHNWNCYSGMIFDHSSPMESFQISFSTMDGAPLTVDVTFMPYVEVIPELVAGENVINVDTFDGKKVQVSTAGEYTISWAEGETNGVLIVADMYGSETLEAPYTFTVAEGETKVFIIYTGDWSFDEINLVLTVAGAETPDEPTDTPDVPTNPDQPTDTPDQPTDTPDQPTDTPDAPTETPDQPTTPEEPAKDPSIMDKVTGMIPDSVKNMIPGCSGVVGGIAGGLTALGVAAVTLLKKKEDNE